MPGVVRPLVAKGWPHGAECVALFGTLATTLAPRFYPAEAGETVSLLLYLATFAVGFVVRPFGAIFFGRIGDLVGRKYAFLVTLLIMGTCTAAIGLLPSYDVIGMGAPILLLVFRILQGLALGGEYGGAAIYVAEHVPDEKRGFYNSFIQITATAGLFVAVMVVIITDRLMSDYSFSHWGYRIPFLISIILVGVSLFIRLKMKESPIFQTLKDSGNAGLYYPIIVASITFVVGSLLLKETRHSACNVSLRRLLPRQRGWSVR